MQWKDGWSKPKKSYWKQHPVFPWQVHRKNLIVPQTEQWAEKRAGWRGNCSHWLQPVRQMLEPGKAIYNRTTAVREGRVQPRNKEHPGEKALMHRACLQSMSFLDFHPSQPLPGFSTAFLQIYLFVRMNGHTLTDSPLFKGVPLTVNYPARQHLLIRYC